MSLEDIIKENTEAIKALTNLIQGTVISLDDKKIGKDVKGSEPVKVEVEEKPVKTKAEKPAKKLFEKPAEEEVKSDPAAKIEKKIEAAKESAKEEATVSYQQISDATMALVQISRDTTISLLKKFGVEKAPQLKKEQYEDYLSEANSILEAGSSKGGLV